MAMVYYFHILVYKEGISMATKKSAASTKKSVKKPATSAKTTTKVTTVKAVSKPTATAKVSRLRSLKLKRESLITASVAELIGTFLLAAVVIVTSGQPLFIMFGLVAIVLAIGVSSGAYVNPALTIGALATRRLTVKRAGAYVLAQIIGALLALVVLTGFVNAAPEVSQEAAMYGQSTPELFNVNPIAEGKEWLVLAAELLGMVIFAFGAAVASRKLTLSPISKAFVMGGSFYLGLVIASTAAGYLSSSVVLNPAIALSLEAFTKWELWSVMVYALTPLVGGVIGYALSDLVHAEDEVTA